MFGILGLVHGSIVVYNGFQTILSDNINNIPLGRIHVGTVIMGILYLSGLSFYIKKIPEKYFPKRFDIWLNSHAIFHIFVVVAAGVFYFTLNQLYNERSKRMCLAS